MKEYDGLLYSEDYRILHGQIKGVLQNEYKLHKKTRRINDGAFWNSKMNYPDLHAEVGVSTSAANIRI